MDVQLGLSDVGGMLREYKDTKFMLEDCIYSPAPFEASREVSKDKLRVVQRMR